MSCSCGCSPCCCTTATETDASECSDPGILSTAPYAAVVGENMCSKRLAAYRGEDDDGNPSTNSNDPLKNGIQVQDADGKVKWTDAPCNAPSKRTIGVSTTAQATEAARYVPFTTGKTAENCDRRVVGPTELDVSRWDYVWVPAMQAFTLVPHDDDATSICTTLMSDIVLDPSNTVGYLIQVESSASMAVGVSLKIGGYEMVVTEIVSDIYVRVESAFTITVPVTLEAGESVCNIGFRPCPRTEEPYADTPVFCLDNRVVALETPADVNAMKVPGIVWRDQDGNWSFVAAPVDPITGIVSSNYYFATPGSPTAGGANIPGFKSLPKFNGISPVTIYHQLTGGVPVAAATTVTLSGTSGYIPGATGAYISIDLWGQTPESDYHCYIKINGVVRAHIRMFTGPGQFQGDAQFNGPFFVPLDDTSEVDIAVVVSPGAPFAGLGFECTVAVEGYLA